jgi:hypothetical protein
MLGSILALVVLPLAIVALAFGVYRISGRRED